MDREAPESMETDLTAPPAPKSPHHDGVEMAPLGSPTLPMKATHSQPMDDSEARLSDLPQLTIAYHNATVSLELPASAAAVQTALSPLVKFARTVTLQAETNTLFRVRNASGCIRPGSMTLIMAPPGHGKSSLLRLLADRLKPDHNDASISGCGANSADKDVGVRYNGLTNAQAAAEGCNVRRLCHLVEQVDEHLPLLTVRETLEFAHECTSVVRNPARVDSVIRMLGLEECQNTILGNALVRGVSGGQKRRVTVGEMLLGDARAVFLDEYTNGLDSATAEDITRSLGKWARTDNASVVATVQQPTPGIFAEYDDIIILNNADVIYHGPRDDVVPFLASMGFNCPEDVDVCDFVIDCISQPRVALQRLQHGEHNAAKAARNTGEPLPDYTALRASSKGLLPLAPEPCVSAHEMLAHYRASPFYRDVLRAVKPFFPSVVVPARDKATSVGSDADTDATASAEDAAAAAAALLPLLPNKRACAAYSTGYVQSLWVLLGLVTSRQITVLGRNKNLIGWRLMQATVMGLVYGSLYFQVTSHSLLVAVAVVAVFQTAFSHLGGLPNVLESARVVYRQTASSFYPSWAYVLAGFGASLPLFLSETAVTAVLYYFMSGYYVSAGNFFVFFSVIFTVGCTMAMWYRFVAAAFKNDATIYAIAVPSTGVMYILSGYLITFRAMPRWIEWLMWISPFSWAVRALANVEFLSARYDELADNGQRLGSVYLHTLDIREGVEWIGYCFLYLVGFTTVIMVATALLSRRPWYEGSVGTRRVEEAEVLESEAEKGEDEASKLRDVEAEYSIALGIDERAPDGENDAAEAAAAAPELSRASAASGACTESVGLKTMNEALPFTPMWLSFKDLHYTVKVPGPDGGLVDRPLLRGVNGYAEPGKLTALMGASGAGKTTLLDVLAGRKNTGVIEGKIQFNGRTPSADDVAYHTGYVEQFDSLFPFDTVRETLLFAARLRLPASVADDVKVAIVDEVLDILELTSIRDYIIGNARVVGLSPSQLKRVNIGCELVANPAILFLDEPTTGLDSRAAQTVVRVVRRIARSGRSVICTIHQPSAELFYLFDRLVLLASGGHQIFFGSLGVRCRHFIPYIESVEGASKCPPRFNPASWMLEEMGVGQASATPAASGADSVSGSDSARPGRYDGAQVVIERFKRAWKGSHQYRAATNLLERLDAVGKASAADAANSALEHGGVESPETAAARHAAEDAADAAVIDAGVLSTAPAPTVTVPTHAHVHDGLGGGKTRMNRSVSYVSSVGHASLVAPLPTAHAEVGHKQPPPLLATYWLLQVRAAKGYWRNPPVLFARSAVITVLSIFFGLLYFDITPTTQSSALSFYAAISMSAIFGAVNHEATALPNFFMNRSVLYREQSSGMYPSFLWALSGFLNECFYTLLTTFISQIPSYFLIGLSSSAGIFFKHYLAMYLLNLCYTSVACLLAAFSPSISVGNVLQGIQLGLFNVFAGVAIGKPAIPRGWVWFYSLVPTSHSTEALVSLQVGNCSPLPLCGPLIEVVRGATTSSMYLAEYTMESMGYSLQGYGSSLGWMVLFIGVAQILSLVGIAFLNFSKR